MRVGGIDKREKSEAEIIKRLEAFGFRLCVNHNEKVDLDRWLDQRFGVYY